MFKNKQELITYLAQGNSVKYLHFWGHTQKSENLDKACLSQWFPATFKHEGDTYLTAEHFMMTQKARLFNDQEMLEAILQADSPALAKKLGRSVKNFDDQAWKKHCFDYVVKGNIAKFSSTPALQQFLLNTKDRVLVEASPRDRIWGIGMGINHPDACNPSRWRGQNLLGFALMKAREHIRNKNNDST